LAFEDGIVEDLNLSDDSFFFSEGTLLSIHHVLMQKSNFDPIPNHSQVLVHGGNEPRDGHQYSSL
jgi:hypothetical protein